MPSLNQSTSLMAIITIIVIIIVVIIIDTIMAKSTGLELVPRPHHLLILISMDHKIFQPSSLKLMIMDNKSTGWSLLKNSKQTTEQNNRGRRKSFLSYVHYYLSLLPLFWRRMNSLCCI